MEPVTSDKMDQLLAVLERLATALETRNMLDAFPQQFVSIPAPLPSAGNGYQCSICHSWVMQGAYHSCGGTVCGVGSGQSMASCGEVGEGGTCWLNDHHSGAHQYARVWNAGLGESTLTVAMATTT